MKFEPVIGLEVHAQLKTKTKIFCSCSTSCGAPPKTHTCPVCLGMPGVLPVRNKKVVEYTLRTAIATNCNIDKVSRFARKNDFYPDLPKGYQISQYELSIAQNGSIEIETNGIKKSVGITRIHKEVTDYKNGKIKLLGFFVGQVMKETAGKANPKIVNVVLKAELGK